MVKQEQITILAITALLITLSIYFLIDFYIHAPLYDLDHVFGSSQAAFFVQDQIANSDTNDTLEFASKTLNK